MTIGLQAFAEFLDHSQTIVKLFLHAFVERFA
jgi:hypothetical protein